MAEDSEYLFGEVLANVSTKLFSKEEKERVSSLLNSDESNVSEIFFGNLKKTQSFRDYAHKRKVNGFPRPGNKKTAEVERRLTRSLKDNSAKNPEWNVYRDVCREYILAQKPTLSELLNEDCDFEEDTFENRDGSLTTEFFKALCARAEEFSVYRQDLKELYDLFPLPRVENIDAILEKAPDYGELNAMSDAMTELRSDFEEHRLDVNRRFREIREGLHGQNSNLDESINTLVDKLDGFDEKLSSQIRSLRNDLTTYKTEVFQAFSDISEEYRATNDYVVQQKTKMDNLEDKLTDFMLTTELRFESASQIGPENPDSGAIAQKSQGDIYHSGWISESLAYQETILDDEELRDVTEDDFLANFVNRCAFDRIQYSKEDMITYHRLIMASPVIQIDNPDLLDCWIKSLGWSGAHFQTSASPTWSDPGQWLQYQRELFQDPDRPAIVSILDFDKGLVSAYLEPILKQWGQADTVNPIKKLFLVRSRTGEPMRDLESPLMCLNEYRPELTFEVGAPSHRPKPASVSIDSFKGWSRTRTFSAGKAKRNRFIRRLVNDDIVAPKALTQLISGVQRTLTSHNESGEIDGYCRRLVLLPWLEATQNEEVVEKYRVES